MNTAATSRFTVGIATPLAGFISNVGNMQATLSVAVLFVGLLGWLTTAICLQSLARRVLRSLVP